MGKQHRLKLKSLKCTEMKIVGSVLLFVLTVVFSLTVFAHPVCGEINNTTDTGIEGIDPELVAGVWNASVEFAEEVTQEINISGEDLGGQGSIDDLITLIQITLPFTSKVLEMVQSEETETEAGMNVTVNESSLIADEMVESAFQYLRFLQSDNLCEEAINIMDQGGTWDD
jgi:hypothetical protein